MTDSRHISAQPRVIAVTGGKGGVGKTSVAINLALALTREGHNVLLLDGDLDLANVAIMLGQYPRHTLEHVLRQECTLDEVIMEAPLGLHVIPGASGVQSCIDMGVAGSLNLLKSLAALERRYDYVLIDTAAGLQPVVLHMIASAVMACVVVTPDPASLTDAFSLIKVLQRQGYRRTPSVLVNMAHGASQAQSIFRRFAAASQNHLGVRPHYLGAVWRDETLRRSVITQRPVALLAQSDPSCRQFHSLADRVKIRLEQLPPRKSGVAAHWYKAVRRSEQDKPTATPANEPTPVKAEIGTRVRQAIVEFNDLISDPLLPPTLRHEALAACFALLGRTIDDDTLEIIQTGLTALDWESVNVTQRAHFATHLQHLASQIAPESSKQVSVQSVTRGSDQEPRYDQVIFGDQECLLKTLREQPNNVSLDHFLRGLAGKTDKRFEG